MPATEAVQIATAIHFQRVVGVGPLADVVGELAQAGQVEAAMKVTRGIAW